MKIKWNGHASFTITANDGTVIVTDPYDPSGYGGVLKYDMVTDRADLALVSHDHLDHNYVEGLTGAPVVMRQSGEAGTIRVIGIKAHHDESEGNDRGPNTVFSFNVDGIHICFVGDLGHQLSPEQIKSIGTVDLLLIPVGGTFTVDASGAADVARSLGAKLTIPMHFKTDKCDLPIQTVEDFLELMPNVKLLNDFEIDLSPDQIPATEPEVWVLTHAC
jgi:L-ascorbate metabolism protein UlaG (beta-lactamase superfamily)